MSGCLQRHSVHRIKSITIKYRHLGDWSPHVPCHIVSYFTLGVFSFVRSFACGSVPSVRELKCPSKSVLSGSKSSYKITQTQTSKRAIAGECEKNEKYMLDNCRPSCMECHMLHIDNRCVVDPNAKPAWEPDGLNAMFEHLISEPIASKYPVTILSRDPWVITLDDVVSEEEAEKLVQLGGVKGYQRSQDVGKRNADGTYGSIVSTGRTSSNAWCTDECYNDPVLTQVANRLSELTMIDEKNSEFLQLLR